MNIIDKMETEALSFMVKRKKIEERLAINMVSSSMQLQKEIEKTLKAQNAINITLLSTFIANEIRPTVENFKKEQKSILDSAIRDDYEVGIENGEKILSLSNEYVTPQDNEIKDSYYEEVLIALLLYGERIIDSLGEDIINNLDKDLTSIYITGKNIRDFDVDKDVNTDGKSVSIIITGALIAKYITSTFKNINNRANMIARNESNRALNHGHMMRYLKAKNDNFKDLMVKWVEVRDDRLCKHCQAAAQGGEFGNGVYMIDEITPPPLHSRCRCILIPYRKTWADTEY